MVAGKGRGADLRRAAAAAQVVLAKHPTVIPSAEPQAVRRPVSRVDTGPVDIGVRNISRLLAR